MNEIINNLWISPDYDIKLTFNIQCPYCGTVVNNYMKYCYECGKKLIVEAKTVKEKVIEYINDSKETFKIFGAMYGGHFENDKIIEITLVPDINCWLSINKDGFYYAWGWPGPDTNFYKWEDYGKTWAFNKEDFKNE